MMGPIGKKKWSADNCNCERFDISRRPGLRIDAADGCWPGAFGRGYKICCAFNGDKRATRCIAHLR